MLKIIIAVVAFCVELCMLVALAYYGYHSSNEVVLKYLLAVGLPLIAAVLWGLLAAPKAKKRLANPYLFFFKLLMFLGTAFLLYCAHQPTLAILFAAIAVLNEVAALFLFSKGIQAEM